MARTPDKQRQQKRRQKLIRAGGSRLDIALSESATNDIIELMRLYGMRTKKAAIEMALQIAMNHQVDVGLSLVSESKEEKHS